MTGVAFQSKHHRFYTKELLMTPVSGGPRQRNNWWYLLLLPPFVALLFPFYLRTDPTLFGFPFFYWYQLMWVFITGILTWIVYLAMRGESK
jgi:hypothetical protein